MHLQAIATAVPPTALSQLECAEMLQRSPVRDRLSRRSVLTLLAILRGDSGIETRHFAVPDLEHVFLLGPDELNEAFRREAPKLAAAALASALARAGLAPASLDALLVCTCTGYLCPGVSSYVAEQMGLRPDAFLQDLVGLGCGAAIPMLRTAAALLAQNPRAVIATVAVEISSAAFFLDDDIGVLISACLFGDGAAALIWTGAPGDGPGLRCHGFNTWHEPAHRDKIRFTQRDGKLRNLLDLSVAGLAAGAVGRLYRAERSERPIARIVSHGGGRDVLDAIEAELPGNDFSPAREVLRRHGNMSSPSVLFALERVLATGLPPEGQDWWLVSFGAGFSAHSCRLGR